MTPEIKNAVMLAAAWAIYFVIHSLLASNRAKDLVSASLPAFMPFYRLTYNILALLLLVPVLLIAGRCRGPLLWEWKGAMFWVMNGIALLAATGLFITLKYYDPAEFSGLRQLKKDQSAEDKVPRLVLSPFHRFVRHPWYFLGSVVLWTRDMDLSFFITSVAVTVYFIIGSRLEEKKLLRLFGDRYERYIEAVPALFPLPWRHLSQEEAKRLLREDPP